MTTTTMTMAKNREASVEAETAAATIWSPSWKRCLVSTT
jgi:hypothetical protein